MTVFGMRPRSANSKPSFLAHSRILSRSSVVVSGTTRFLGLKRCLLGFPADLQVWLQCFLKLLLLLRGEVDFVPGVTQAKRLCSRIRLTTQV